MPKNRKNFNIVIGSLTKPTLFDSSQVGQTLIETVVAVFILVMGIVAALGLAVYSLNASSNITKQIIAIGLAREGVETVKNMRDNNWLITSLTNSCYDFSTSQSNAPCYVDWLSGPPGASGAKKGYNFDPGNPNNSQKCFRVQVNSASSGDTWSIKDDNCSNANHNNDKWGLDIDTSLSGTQFPGVFGVSSINQGVNNGTSDFYRKIVITKTTTAPYDKANMPKILVESQVWWVDKKCPRVTDFTLAKDTCRLSLQTYLTNWKNY